MPHTVAHRISNPKAIQIDLSLYLIYPVDNIRLCTSVYEYVLLVCTSLLLDTVQCSHSTCQLVPTVVVYL